MDIKSSTKPIPTMTRTTNRANQREENLIQETERFLSSPEGSAITYGLMGAVPGLGGISNFTLAAKIGRHPFATRTPKAQAAISYGSIASAAANALGTVALLADLTGPSPSTGISGFCLSVFAASSILGGIAGYSLATLDQQRDQS